MNYLIDVDTSAKAVGLAVSATHPCERCMNIPARLRQMVFLTGLQTICARTCEHFVDTDHVVRVESHAKVKVVLADRVDHVLVGRNAGRLKRFRGDLLLLKRKQMNTGREKITASPLLADVINLDFGV